MNTPDAKSVLVSRLAANDALQTVLAGLESLGLPDAWVGAGAIPQTAWNVQFGRDPNADIKDLDLVYFDPDDLSAEAEEAWAERARQHFGALPWELDVANEARVHLWYERVHGYAIPPYPSVEAAIATWPTTASAVGVRLQGSELEVHAPYGLTDLLAGIVRPNKVQITESIFRAKAERWKRCWPFLEVVPW